ncbi:anti-sigma factor [Hanstruepera neustonica]|uniref:Anti-sigma factor n=1 Tax=Hanstruepera neustonica TaxID=1445657 RepID=A0A2K1E307_9FLAO|nr:FecR family protein [Hanstruepera neustonica]PNQ74674.1 anti-sigma factor [Hanstruepera neustonica]
MENEQLIKKWLNNELTTEEEAIFKGSADYSKNQAIIDDAQAFKASNFYQLEDFASFKKHYNENQKKSKQLNWKLPFLRIASVIVIALCVYSVFYFNNTTQIKTLAAEKTTFELPDASSVTLNSVSEVSFIKRNWDSNRSLHLKGEAFFKVSKGKTFDVITSAGTVTVVGTQFNVKQRQNFFYVECYEGIVSVTSDTITRKLHAGDSFKIYNGSFSEDHSDFMEPRWIDNSSTFHAIALKDVLSELERQYNLEITHQNVDIEKLFTGTFTHNNLEQALISITQPMNLNYEVNSSNRVVLYENKD